MNSVKLILIASLAVLAGSSAPGFARLGRETLRIPDPPFQGKMGLLADHKLTDEELRMYREGRVRAALAQ